MNTKPHRLLGDDLRVFPVGLGCMGMSGIYGPADESEALATIEQAIDHGANMFDTADMYGAGHNEELLGRAVASRRDEVVIATKFGQVLNDKGRPVGIDGSPAWVRKAFEASARRLGVDHVDLYFQHRVDRATPIEETVGAIAELVAEGKVRHIGLCEASAATIRRAHAVHRLAAVQTEYSLWWRGIEAEVLPTCEELGIGVVAYSPLGRGLLSGAVRAPDYLGPEDRRRDHPRFDPDNLAHNLGLVAELERLAGGLGCEPTQLALAWLLAKGDHIVPIPGAKRRDHLSSNLAAAEILLSIEDVAQLDAALPVGAGAGLRYPEQAMGALES
ncbi:MAG: aldo/keto reductase [Acidimicrobiales bacterium]